MRNFGASLGETNHDNGQVMSPGTGKIGYQGPSKTKLPKDESDTYKDILENVQQQYHIGK